MLSETKAKRIIQEVFEEQALVIGGLLPFHEVDDEFIWKLLKGVDVVRNNAIRQLSGAPPVPSYGDRLKKLSLAPHPAVEDFLSKLEKA